MCHIPTEELMPGNYLQVLNNNLLLPNFCDHRLIQLFFGGVFVCDVSCKRQTDAGLKTSREALRGENRTKKKKKIVQCTQKQMLQGLEVVLDLFLAFCRFGFFDSFGSESKQNPSTVPDKQ